MSEGQTVKTVMWICLLMSGWGLSGPTFAACGPIQVDVLPSLSMKSDPRLSGSGTAAHSRTRISFGQALTIDTDGADVIPYDRGTDRTCSAMLIPSEGERVYIVVSQDAGATFRLISAEATRIVDDPLLFRRWTFWKYRPKSAAVQGLKVVQTLVLPQGSSFDGVGGSDLPVYVSRILITRDFGLSWRVAPSQDDWRSGGLSPAAAFSMAQLPALLPQGFRSDDPMMQVGCRKIDAGKQGHIMIPGDGDLNGLLPCR
jgi:hypothetical protein